MIMENDEFEEQHEINEIQPEKYRTPDYVFDLEAKKDIEVKIFRNKKYVFWLSMMTLVVFLASIIKAEPSHVLQICYAFIPVVLLEVGYLVGSDISQHLKRYFYGSKNS